MNEKTYVLNIKNKQGTIYTFRGDTAVDLETALLDFVRQDLTTTILEVENMILNAPVAVVQQQFNGQVVSEQPLSGFAPIPPSGPAAMTPAPILATSGKACMHGPMTKREGTGQWGPYKAYYCPTPKGTPDQCKPVYIKPNDPEWQTF